MDARWRYVPDHPQNPYNNEYYRRGPKRKAKTVEPLEEKEDGP